VLTAARIRLLVATALIVMGAFGVDALGAGSPAAEGWDATLDYTAAKAPLFPRVSRLRLRVTHGGVVVYNRIVPLPRACVTGGCRLGSAAGGPSFQLVDFGSSKGPTALIWLWTGGAHCCTVVRAVSIPGGAMAARNFGDSGARLAVLSGSRVLVSADDRFAYLFTSYASSGLPVQIFRFRGGRFVNVTGQFKEAIAADQARWWTLTQRARRSQGEARGVFAAWAADTCALGKKADVRRELAIAVAAGTFSPPRGEPGGPTGAQYASELQRKLTSWGYCG
jgi:hypothetical protein